MARSTCHASPIGAQCGIRLSPHPAAHAGVCARLSPIRNVVLCSSSCRQLQVVLQPLKGRPHADWKAAKALLEQHFPRAKSRRTPAPAEEQTRYTSLSQIIEDARAKRVLPHPTHRPSPTHPPTRTHLHLPCPPCAPERRRHVYACPPRQRERVAHFLSRYSDESMCEGTASFAARVKESLPQPQLSYYAATLTDSGSARMCALPPCDAAPSLPTRHSPHLRYPLPKHHANDTKGKRCTRPHTPISAHSWQDTGGCVWCW